MIDGNISALNKYMAEQEKQEAEQEERTLPS
jgi:hypothetical protein